MRTLWKASAEWDWLSQAFRAYRWRQFAASGGAFAAALTGLMDPLLLKTLIDKGLQLRNSVVVIGALAALLGLYVLRCVLLYWSTMSATRLLNHAAFALRLRLFQKLELCDAKFYASQQTGDLMYRLEQDVDAVVAIGIDAVPAFARIIAAAVVVLTILFWLQWHLAVLLLPLLLGYLAVRTFFRRVLDGASQQMREIQGARASFISEWLAGILQIQELMAERIFRRKYRGLLVASTRTSIGQKRYEMFYVISVTLMTAIITVSILAGGAYGVFSSALTLGGFVAFYGYLGKLLDPLTAATEVFAHIRRVSSNVRHLMDIELLMDVSHSVAPEGPTLPQGHAGGVSLRNVSFGYTDTPVLTDISLDVLPGTMTALVGKSGSGKSTLAKLCARICDATNGEITLFDLPIRGLPLSVARQSISLIHQHPILFRGTLRDNVLLGNPKATQVHMERCAYLSCFDEVVEKFPLGWEHPIGHLGLGLSDGEKQRLGIARALLQDRPIIILDEATSALDIHLESKVFKRLREFREDKAMLVITHRLTPARESDGIIVMHNGRIVGRMSPTELDQGNDRLELVLAQLCEEQSPEAWQANIGESYPYGNPSSLVTRGNPIVP